LASIDILGYSHFIREGISVDMESLSEKESIIALKCRGLKKMDLSGNATNGRWR